MTPSFYVSITGEFIFARLLPFQIFFENLCFAHPLAVFVWNSSLNFPFLHREPVEKDRVSEDQI